MYNNIFAGKKILITGNTGFKGSWLSVWLNKLGAAVYGASIDIPTTPSMFEVTGLEELTRHNFIDVRDLPDLIDLFANIRPDFVFHLAAQPIVAKSYIDPVETISTNVIGTANILEALRIVNIACTAIVITSDKCYDNVEWVYGYKESDKLGGKDVYSGSKAAAEIIVKSYFQSYFSNLVNCNVRVATARAGNVIGGGDWAENRIVPDCIRAWALGKSVEIRNPQSTRPWQLVLEPISGYLNLAAQLHNDPRLNGESFNFGPPSDLTKTVKELLDDLGTSWDLSFNPSRLTESTSDFHGASLLKLNCDKALFYLKWLPTLDYVKLIEFTGSWYRKYYNSGKNMIEITLEQISEYESIALSKGILWTK